MIPLAPETYVNPEYLMTIRKAQDSQVTKQSLSTNGYREGLFTKTPPFLLDRRNHRTPENYDGCPCYLALDWECAR